MNPWPIVALAGHIDEVSVRKGDTPAKVLSVTNTEGFVRSLDVFDKQVFSQDVSNYKLVRPNDLAYNPSRINVGSVARCHLPEGGAVSPMYIVVRCRHTLSPQYLLYFLKSDIGRQHIVHRCVGAVRFMLRFRDLEQIQLPLPPRPEQERIVRILDESDALRRLRTETSQRTKQLTAALFEETFGDPVTNARQWPAEPLGNLLALMEYGPRFYNEAYSVSGTRIVRITDLDDTGNLRFDDMPRMELAPSTVAARGLRAGDFIFARSGATAGKLALVPESAPPCIAGAYFIRFRLKDSVEPIFARELLCSRPIQHIVQKQAKQAAQPNFSGPLLRELPIILPPPPLQRTFAARVAEIREIEVAQVASVSTISSNPCCTAPFRESNERQPSSRLGVPRGGVMGTAR